MSDQEVDENFDARDRRQYSRVHAPVYCRPAGLGSWLRSLRKPKDISLGGLRVYADEPIRIGERLELELFLPSNESVTCTVEVMWVESIPGGDPAPYDVGVRYVFIRSEDVDKLSDVLQPIIDAQQRAGRAA